jgi:hypothetical protein
MTYQFNVADVSQLFAGSELESKTLGKTTIPYGFIVEKLMVESNQDFVGKARQSKIESVSRK